ncbi:MAG: hypothetical protein ACE5HT_11630, partial [Gemmatimonadales bacterium]
MSPVLGVKHVRQAAEYYRDVLSFSLDPIDGVYAIVKRLDVWIHFQIRRGEIPHEERPVSLPDPDVGAAHAVVGIADER